MLPHSTTGMTCPYKTVTRDGQYRLPVQPNRSVQPRLLVRPSLSMQLSNLPFKAPQLSRRDTNKIAEAVDTVLVTRSAEEIAQVIRAIGADEK